MYIIREIFNTKPDKAKDLVAKLKKASAAMKKEGFNTRVMTDTVATYWTVVAEIETDDLSKFFNLKRNPEMEEAMQGYMELLNGGHREIFKLE